MDSISTSVARAVTSHVLYLDELLERIAMLCKAPNGTRQYALYSEDVSHEKLGTTLDGVRRCRDRLDGFDKRWSLGPPQREVLLSKALVVELQFFDIALDEMTLDRLAGYGAMAGEASSDYVRLVADCKALVAEIRRDLVAHG
ncbi:hypothetical protein [Burkholderia pseudomultivorans]|uniref:hypothetical protein n=1 Tax=Burkholderia pseudomultivorans TaxID=1207504 RepID=UPI0012D93471|nr:hypothetical protein [Burkholderia pseudomultivorans]